MLATACVGSGKGHHTSHTRKEGETLSILRVMHDCKKCCKPHTVYVEQDDDPEDGSVYAYECPNSHCKVKFRWKEMAWIRVSSIPDGSVIATLSKA